MSFRDEHERKAHDVICIIKYGGIGGSVRTEDVRRIGDVLRGKPLAPAIVPPPAGVFRVPAVMVQLPTELRGTPAIPTIRIPTP